ncbi:TetR/AcrR family transcriptional regulator [Mesorhizobium sp. M1409]|uniref:TetR/AcrR family transcriptional regulator n=1 Tax=unclassified Mesorhizobium TaxID=325217 RepID=UPI00333CCB82
MRYEKGRKEASKRRIVEIAAQKFRSDGIAATGLAGIMTEAGLTNGAFYPHFKSKAALVGESVSAALEEQSQQIAELLVAGGPDMVIDTYLSAAHRDNPGIGCASSALLSELGREPAETRHLYTEHVRPLVHQLADQLDPQVADRESVAMAVFATLIGSLQLARTVDDAELSDRILTAGAEAARTLVRPR